MVVFNNNEDGKPVDPNLIVPLERISNENQSEQGRSYKLLGVYLDELFTFNYHVQHLCKKLSKSMFFSNEGKKLCLCKIIKVTLLRLYSF
jgi:hypothetical protein